MVANNIGLSIYNYEHKNEGDPISTLKYKYMRSISIAQREFMSAPNAFELSFNLPFFDSENEHEVPLSDLSIAWNDAFIEAGNTSEKKLAVYICADSTEQMRQWMDFIEVRIKAYLAFSNRKFQ